MTVELDHVFVWVSAGGPEVDCLAALGVTEGKPNRHPGQGTACRRFFFANAYLEFIWVENAEEVQGEVARPLRFWERWSGRGTGACPFGVILRPARQGSPAAPFPGWEYRPPYLPKPQFLHVAENISCVTEPVLVYFSRPHTPGSLLQQSGQGLDHRAGFREVTALRLFSPHARTPSAALRAVADTAAFAFHEDPEHLAEIGFDGERQGRRADLRPALPLVICW